MGVDVERVHPFGAVDGDPGDVIVDIENDAAHGLTSAHSRAVVLSRVPSRDWSRPHLVPVASRVLCACNRLSVGRIRGARSAGLFLIWHGN